MTNKVINVLAILAILFLAVVIIGITKRTITGNVVAGTEWCRGADVNHDRIVNMTDRDLVEQALVNRFNTTEENCKDSNSWCNYTDIDRDGYVNDTDVFLVENGTTTDFVCTGEQLECTSDSECGVSSGEKSICDSSTLVTEARVPTCSNSGKCVVDTQTISSRVCVNGCINNSCINLTLPDRNSSCIPSWSCGNWSICSNTAHVKTKICTDLNSCGNISGRPAIIQNCTSTSVSQNLTIPSLILCSKDIDCGSPKAINICQGNISCINSTVYQCISPGTVGSYCKALSAIGCDKNCPFGCIGAGICGEDLKPKTEIDLLEEIILGLNSKLPQPVIANKSAKSFVSCDGGDINKDGVVNLSDFQIFKKEFQKNSTGINDTRADINNDHLVDVKDFAAIKDNFGTTNCNINKPFTYNLCVFTLTSIESLLNLNKEQVIATCENFIK